MRDEKCMKCITDTKIVKQKNAVDQIDEETAKSYLIEMEKLDNRLQDFFIKSNCNHDEIIKQMLRLTNEFYQADWCGVLNVDMSLGLWLPLYWYSKKTGLMGETLINAFEASDDFKIWIKALKSRNMVYIADKSAIEKSFPKEAEQYKRLGVNSAMGAPFYQGIDGFLVVKNAKRFCDNGILLKNMAFAVSGEIMMMQEQENESTGVFDEDLQEENDVLISLFDHLQISKKHHEVKPDLIENKVIGQMIAILAISDADGISKDEMSSLVRSRQSTDGVEVDSLKHHLFNFGRETSGMFERDNKLIITSDLGNYVFNHRYHIKRDLDIFDNLLLESEKSNDIEKKLECLTRAKFLYRKGVLPAYKDFPWIQHIRSQYEAKYVMVAEKLCELLFKRRDYSIVVITAMDAIKTAGDTAKLWYWAITAAENSGSRGAAVKYYNQARSKLEGNAFKTLEDMLDIEV
ncbi:transcriptional activator domain-containing protein [Butyrivibrio sp. INlla14]|nr:transcriptional activator domain-containing protein [Butyrivibrio sp. INlla14]